MEVHTARRSWRLGQERRLIMISAIYKIGFATDLNASQGTLAFGAMERGLIRHLFRLVLGNIILCTSPKIMAHGFAGAQLSLW